MFALQQQSYLGQGSRRIPFIDSPHVSTSREDTKTSITPLYLSEPDLKIGILQLGGALFDCLFDRELVLH